MQMPVSPIIRPANRHDHGMLCELFRELDEYHRRERPDIFRQPSGPQRSAEFLDATMNGPDSTILVAETPAAQLIGLVTLFVRTIPANIVRDERRFVEVTNLVVRADTRRQGVGRLLVEAAAAWSARVGAPGIELSVWSFNACGKSLYRATGFETITERMVMDTARQASAPGSPRV
jgi:ribosomal protein S18 acetylase RimI-like enzyme